MAVELLAQHLLAVQGQGGNQAPQSERVPLDGEAESGPRAKQLPPELLAYILTCMSHDRKAVRKEALQALKALASATARLTGLLAEDITAALQDLASTFSVQVSALLLLFLWTSPGAWFRHHRLFFSYHLF